VFGSNSKLAILNLKNNLISKLPQKLCHWSHLKEINIGSNKICEIPDSIGKLINCEDLKLSNNNIG